MANEIAQRHITAVCARGARRYSGPLAAGDRQCTALAVPSPRCGRRGRSRAQREVPTMSLTTHAVPAAVENVAPHGETRAALEAFWARAELTKLKARFSVAREMDVLPRLSIQALRAIAFQY